MRIKGNSFGSQLIRLCLSGALGLAFFGGAHLRATSGATIAQPAAASAVQTGVAVTFTGSSTCDAVANADSGSVSYSWLFGDGGSGAGASTTHAYTAAGTYTVSFTANWTLTTYIDGLHPHTITSHYTYAATETITVLAPAIINSLSSSAQSVLQGGGVTLNWSTSNATAWTVSGVGTVTGTSVTVYPNATTTYTLTASNALGSVNASVTVSTLPVTVAIAPGTALIKLGESVTFTGSASAANPAVTWSANGGSLSGSTFTGISSSTTPFTVTAKSVADPTKSASASVTVATVAVATPVPVPSNGQALVGGTVSFTAQVSGAVDTGVTWSVNGGGAISPTGTFTATTLGTWTITATSKADPTKTSSIGVSVVPAQIAISPSPATVRSGATQQFSASVTGAGSPGQSVSWSVVEPNGGSITPAGVYTAPTTAGDYTVKATWTTDGISFGLQKVHVPGWVLHWTKDVVYVGTKEVAEVDNQGKTWVTFVDHLGSPRLAWDGTAATTVDRVHLIQQKFMPFGESLADPTSASKFEKGFTNHEQTDPSGLIYMQARFYAPWFGRFLTPDPARDQHFEATQSWNIYSYVQNNPTMSVDPTGMFDDPVSQWSKPWATSNALGKVAGFLGGAASMAKGVGHMVAHPIQTAVGLGNAIAHPVATAQAVANEVKTSAQNAHTPFEQGKLEGRASFEILAALAPAAGAIGKTGEAGEAARLAGAANDTREAASAMNGLNLQKQLASESQLSEAGSAMAGVGERKAFRDAAQKAANYGGDAADYKKMSSSTFEAKDGTRMETHWVENTKTGEQFEHKTKLLNNEKKP